MKPALIGLIGFIGGGAVASAAWSVQEPKAPPAKPEPVVETTHRDVDLEKANANLTSSLQECDRRLAELGEKPVAVPSAAPAASDERRGRGRRSEMSKEDWERMAENGVVPVRIPCIRDTPWTPSERVIDRLGLAPSDVDALKEAYAASNKRMIEAIRPLCAEALGSPEAADRVGASQCIDVINNTARKANADDTKAALSRVAEVQAGKREAPKPDAHTSAVEKLGYLLTNEQKTFENDLAQKLGPEDAKRLVNEPGLCSERKMLRAGEIDPSTFGGRQRGAGR
jgi:hypothetical protein